ncbi:glycosyltransferase family 39 protein [Microbispora sp. RL4-1S]|uniref:Glycosyltransferase family 39 protein n=1 Tax=Microbispora oryzae TaxID=2806554 RepID=A0A940WJA2_9ACTN|nr:glycosyltransferase family 39 protein [Microbispora oryzae]MBP2706655.1 glycosyltransferase family 39 protein [Microbispora oryzae]
MTTLTAVRPDARISRTPVLAIALATTVVLLVNSPWYGYHRDELYFRLLGEHPRLGYFDTPPLTPMIARVSTAVFGDTLVALRVVPALAAGVLVLLIAIITRELGGNRRAEILAAAGTATGMLTLVAGHTLLTLTTDLVLWTGVTLLVIRALKGDGRQWIWVGLLAGVATYNRDLIVMLLGGIGVGVVLCGPREVLRDRRLWIGAALALLIASPNLYYQATHGWPQFQMATALRENDGTGNRLTFVPLQVVLIGIPQAVVGVVGWRRLWRDRRLRPLAVAYPVACAATLFSGGRPDYTGAFLLYLFAAGCVSAAAWRRRPLLAGALGLNAVINIVLALPVIPESSLASTPVPAVNETAREAVGMRGIAQQVANVVRALPAQDRAGAVVLADNYGEAGALDRWSGEFGLPRIYSSQNELWWWGPPPEGTRVVVAVGFPLTGMSRVFGQCAHAATVQGVIGEEEGRSVIVCRDPRLSWPELWPRMRHYD